MPAALETQDLLCPCELPGSSNLTKETPLMMYGCVGAMLKNITPISWTTGFKSLLTIHNGAVILLVKDRTDEKYLEALKTYEEWSQCDPSDLLFETYSMTWFEKFDEIQSSEGIKSFTCTIQDNMLILCGEFPKITVMVGDLFENSFIVSNQNLNLVIVGVFDWFTKNIEALVKQVANDITKGMEEARYTTYLCTSSFNMYIYSRKLCLSQLSSMVFQQKKFMSLVKKNLEIFGLENCAPSIIVNNTVVERNFERYITSLFINLLEMKETQERNRAKTFKSLKEIAFLFWLLVILICIVAHFVLLD
ncbi:hypothetical protein, no similarity [Maudiozyma saulgeensis]|uniref:Uncharacterized protein n=1 Tax=Maudiozyma saulgeensis TaxID=1789683 RepID=A0A1X7QWF7_9SACH|nr:hypothetical protein, no similarity [Kazachstania saulgeensis]